MSVRSEHSGDQDRVREINLAAFETGEEAEIVDRLRLEADPTISLVALRDDAVIGHIMFSPITIDDQPGAVLLALGPMAVLPAHQRSGIGTSLAAAGLERCKEFGVDGVIVLGHPTYYPRFKFRPASEFGIRCPFKVPDEVFMALESTPGSLLGIGGEIRYHPAFGI